MKRAIAICLSVWMLFALSQAIYVNAADFADKNYGNWIGYVNDDGTFTVTGCRSIGEYVSDQTLKIPSEIEGMTVTGIGLYMGERAFYIFDHPTFIEAIILPDTLENVETNKDLWGVNVFRPYTEIKKLVLPNNEQFGYDDVNNLFGYGVTLNELKEIECCNESQIGYYLDVSNVEKITIHNAYSSRRSIVELSGFSFPNLKEINLSSAIQGLKLSGFEKFQTLDLSLMQVSVLYIENMKNLKKLTIPASVVALYLSDCPVLADLSYPGDVKDLSLERLRDCPMLDYPVAYINAYSYGEQTSSEYLEDRLGPPYANSRIRELHIDSARMAHGVDKEYFRSMPSLERFVVYGDKSRYYTRDGVLYWGNYTYDFYGGTRYANDLAAYPAAKSTTGTLELPEDITCIYAYALDGCKFTSITFPENIHKDYYWDDVAVFNGTDFDTCYLYNMFPGKFRVVKNSIADMTLYVNSRKEYYTGSTYKIDYELNGGTNHAENPASYVAGEIVTLKDPTREGYTFLGWTRNDISDITYYTNTTSRNVYFRDLTFTAHWQKEAASASLPGDIDGDGGISASDARLALRASVGLEELGDAKRARADVDGDGAVSAADARLILRRSVGFSDPEYRKV